jgi:UDP-glucose 4-epimerase
MDLRRIVLLGHSGFVGRHLAAHLSRRHPALELIALSVGELDLTRAESVERLTALFTADAGVGVVMTAGIKRQWGDSLEAFSGNLDMAANVCRALAARPVSRFLFFSSAAVYGESNHNQAIDEDTAISPSSYYGIAKFASERLLRQSLRRGLVALRPPLIYGPGDSSKSYGPAGFIRAALDGEPIALWGDGEEKREFIYVGDVAELSARLLFSDFEGPLNVASGRQYTFRGAAEIAARLVCGSAAIASRPRSKAKVDHGFHNYRLAGLFPDFRFHSLEDGMRRTLEAERLR